MVPITKQNKPRVIEILSKAFDNNGSINYLVKQDKKRKKRIEKLVKYLLFQGEKFGKVVTDEDLNAVLIFTYSDKKKTTLASIIQTVKLALGVVGIENIPKALKREALLKKNHPTHPFVHMWFLGVDPKKQNEGIGDKLLRQAIVYCKDKPIYAETSVTHLLNWYQKLGFEIIKTLDLGYTLYVMKINKSE